MSSWEEQGYQLMSTDQMIEALESGKKLSLVPVTVDDEEILSHYGDAERNICFADEAMNEIVSIEYVGEEDVQCILIDDPEHLYLTDGFIPTHNTSNIVFLKSTDDSLLDTLQKLSGTKHTAYRESKNITEDREQRITPNESKLSYTYSVKEEPVISYNDLAFIPDRNSMVFRAGDSPIWNKNETILPMSWRLFQDKIVDPGHDYTLQTIPTMSTAKDFDVRKNIPDFEAMLDKRIFQAITTEEASDVYKKITKKTDLELAQMDPDVKAEEIMSIINASIHQQQHKNDERTMSREQAMKAKRRGDSLSSESSFRGSKFDHRHEDEDNPEVRAEIAKASQQQSAREEPKFAGKRLCPEDFYGALGVNRQYENEIIEAVNASKAGFLADRRHFQFDIQNFELRSADGKTIYMKRDIESEQLAKDLQGATTDPESRIFAEDPSEIVSQCPVYVEDAFFKFLAEQPTWKTIANGRFEREMAKIIEAKMRPL